MSGTVDGMVNATATTIPSTLLASTSLPASIGNPTSTEQVTSIVMASGYPKTSSVTIPEVSPMTGVSQDATSPSSPALTSVSTLEKYQGPTNASPENVKTMGLNVQQIIGISVGAGGIVVLLISFVIFWYCRRRKRALRRRSNRWSTLGPQVPPKSDQGSDPHARVTFHSTVKPSSQEQGQRYYSATPMQEKRRSFWRKSIKPEEIGIAVSPEVNTESPNSYNSQQSTSILLPKPLPALPSRPLWPSPLNLSASKRSKQISDRTSSVSTIFDEETGEDQGVDRGYVTHSRCSTLIATPPTTNSRRVRPPSLQLSPTYAAQPSVRSYRGNYYQHMPLTPIYDNGNIIHRPQRVYQSSTWPMPQVSLNESSKANDNIKQSPATSVIATSRNVLRKKPRTRPGILNRDVFASGPIFMEATPPVPPIPPLPRKESGDTVNTEIEEGTPPEELEKRLEVLQIDDQMPHLEVVSAQEQASSNIHVGQSQLSNMKYPAIPRLANASEQVETQRRSYLADQYVLCQPSGPHLLTQQASSHRTGSDDHCLTRDELVSAETSFQQSNTTLSNGCETSCDGEMPTVYRTNAFQNQNHLSITPKVEVIAANQAASNANAFSLRENPASANRGSVLRQSIVTKPKTINPGINGSPGDALKTTVGLEIATPQRCPNSKVRITPGKTRTGDLYLTVEI